MIDLSFLISVVITHSYWKRKKIFSLKKAEFTVQEFCLSHKVYYKTTVLDVSWYFRISHVDIHSFECINPCPSFIWVTTSLVVYQDSLPSALALWEASFLKEQVSLHSHKLPKTWRKGTLPRWFCKTRINLIQKLKRILWGGGGSH